jgi:chorismate synthase
MIGKFAPIPMDEAKVRTEGCIHNSSAPTWRRPTRCSPRSSEIKNAGDSSGGGRQSAGDRVPPGAMGEPVFRKLDGELGRMLSIGAFFQSGGDRGRRAGQGYDRLAGANDQLYATTAGCGSGVTRPAESPAD